MPRGRPKKHATPEALKAARKAVKQKFKNVSIDADLVEALNTLADSMVSVVGFRPTISQAIRYAIKKALDK